MFDLSVAENEQNGPERQNVLKSIFLDIFTILSRVQRSWQNGLRHRYRVPRILVWLGEIFSEKNSYHYFSQTTEILNAVLKAT